MGGTDLSLWTDQNEAVKRCKLKVRSTEGTLVESEWDQRSRCRLSLARREEPSPSEIMHVVGVRGREGVWSNC